MRCQPIYIIVHGRGDGYGHNSYQYVAWFFDEQEARAYARDREKDGGWFDVEEVLPGNQQKAEDE